MHDAYRFSLKYWFIIEQAPLQTYHSALMFSPSTSILRNLFESQIPCWVNCVSEVENTWGSLLQTLEGHTQPVKLVTFSSDGQKLASASSDSVRIWNVATGTPLQALQGHNDYEDGFRKSMVFSFDGQRIAFLSTENVRIWGVVFGSLLQTFANNVLNSIRSIALSPGGQNIVFGYSDGTIAIRDITFGSLLKTFEGHYYITSVAFSPNGQKLASASDGYDGAICVWDVASGSRLHMVEGYFTSVIFSPDGHKLASGTTNGTIHIWDAESRSLLQTRQDHNHCITWITFLNNGQDLASRSKYGIVYVGNTTSGEWLQTWKDLGVSAAISPDGQKLAFGCNDQTVRITNTAFGSLAQTLKCHHDCISLMTFSPDGKRLASGSGSDLVCVWDVATGSLLEMLEGYSRSIAFSPDGEKLAYISRCASGGHHVKLWDAAYGLSQSIEIYRDVSSVKFSPDGQKLASLSYDGTVRIWNAESGLPLQTIADDYNWVRSSAISTANQPGVLSITGRWVTVNQERIIWLPPNRQASKFVTHGTKIAIGSTTGVVTILDLDFEQMDHCFTSPSVSLDESESDVDSD